LEPAAKEEEGEDGMKRQLHAGILAVAPAVLRGEPMASPAASLQAGPEILIEMDAKAVIESGSRCDVPRNPIHPVG